MEEKRENKLISRKPVRTLLIIAGSISVFLGVLGIFLPILPTTPFLLLAAYCYARSSERFYTWLITNRLFGKYIHNYREGLGIKLSHKLFTMFLLWLTIGYSTLVIITNMWIRLLLIIIAISVTIHLIMLKTNRSEEKEEKQI